MQGGVYQTGSSFGMNSYYRPPQIVGTINFVSTRTSGVITPSDPQRPSIQTSVVIGLVKNTSFEQQVNNTQDLKHIDYDQNPKPISIQLYTESAVDTVASIKSLYTGGRRGVEPYKFITPAITQTIHTNWNSNTQTFTLSASTIGNYNDGNIMNISLNSISQTSIQYITNILSPNINIESSFIIIKFEFETKLTGFYFSFNINGTTINVRDDSPNAGSYFISPQNNGNQKYYIYTYPINTFSPQITISAINLSTDISQGLIWSMDTNVSIQYGVSYTPK